MQKLKSLQRFYSRGYLVLLVILALFTIGSFTGADSDARPATKQEKEFYSMVNNTVAKSLPARPAGWDIVRETKIEELKYVATGLPKNSPFAVIYDVSWQNTKRKTEEEAKIQQAVDEQYSQQQQSPNNATQDALMKQYEKLALDLEKAFNAGDTKKVQQIQVDMEKVAAKMNNSYEADDEERNKLVEKMSPHDVDVTIIAYANFFEHHFIGQVKQEAAIAGGQVYRTGGRFTPERGWEEGTTYVFLGKNWKFKRSGEYASMNAEVIKGVTSLTAQTMIVIIEADPARAQDIVKKINWESLRKLIAK